mgnify:CR=1 FL=1|jgi:hypothetical protein
MKLNINFLLKIDIIYDIKKRIYIETTMGDIFEPPILKLQILQIEPTKISFEDKKERRQMIKMSSATLLDEYMKSYDFTKWPTGENCLKYFIKRPVTVNIDHDMHYTFFGQLFTKIMSYAVPKVTNRKNMRIVRVKDGDAYRIDFKGMTDKKHYVLRSFFRSFGFDYQMACNENLYMVFYEVLPSCKDQSIDISEHIMSITRSM